MAKYEVSVTMQRIAAALIVFILGGVHADDCRAQLMESTRLSVGKLTCEYAVNPLGIDVAQPRFSWVLESTRRGQMQSAYRVLVADDEAALNLDVGNKWDSGKVASGESVNVVYEGKALQSGEACWWKVRWWNKDGTASPWSEPATFEMGLLNPEDWQGEWIGANGGDLGETAPAPLLRKEFKVAKQVERARAHISGLGWYELFVNGTKVGNNALDPATTDYHKRVLYVTHDITEQLREGPNAIGVTLGNGWYSEPGTFKYGDSPRLLLQLHIEFADGSTTVVPSDRTWKSSMGPIVSNDISNGEVYDARLEKPGWATAGYDDSQWEQVGAKESPGGTLQSQLMPAVKVMETLKPVSLTNPKPGIYVYDMGQLFGVGASACRGGSRH